MTTPQIRIIFIGSIDPFPRILLFAKMVLTSFKTRWDIQKKKITDFISK